MPMSYREFRDLYRGMGAEEVWRQKVEGYELALVARKQEILIPFSFQAREVILPDGDNTILEDEEIEAHIRVINKLLGKPGGSNC
jgi:hypothetical protein